MTAKQLFAGIVLFIAGVLCGTAQVYIIQHFPKNAPTPIIKPIQVVPTATPSATPAPTDTPVPTVIYKRYIPFTPTPSI